MSQLRLRMVRPWPDQPDRFRHLCYILVTAAVRPVIQLCDTIKLLTIKIYTHDQVVTKHSGLCQIKVNTSSTSSIVQIYIVWCTINIHDIVCAMIVCCSWLYTDLHSKYPGALDSEPELLDLMNEVAAEIPGKWRDIGLQLGLEHGILDGIAPSAQEITITHWKNKLVVLTTEWLPWLQSWVGYVRFLLVLET